MKRAIGSHRMTDHMRFIDAERVHDRDDVAAHDVLAVACRIVGDVGRRIAALTECHAAVRAREIAHLRFPGAVIAGEFMDEATGMPAPTSS